MTKTTAMLEHTDVERLKQIAQALGVSFQVLLRNIIHHHVAGQPKPPQAA